MTTTTPLNVLLYRTGPADLLPVVLLHAFPLDARMYWLLAELYAVTGSSGACPSSS